DPDGDALHLASVTQGQHGSVAISGDSVVYTPDPDLFGDDVFTYTVADDFGGEAVGTVTVHADLPPSGTVTTVAAISGTDAPGAGTDGGRPAGSKLLSFGTPALSDARQLAATVTLAAGNRRLAGLLYIDETGASTLPAFAGAPAAGPKPGRFQS